MSQACPVNFTTIDNTVSRIVSFWTFAIVVTVIGTHAVLPLYLLGIDLLTRLYGNKRYSPLFITAMAVKRFARLPMQTTDGASKTVAGHFGLIFIASMIIALHLHLDELTALTGLVFAGCLLLDVLFDFCLGCKVHHLYLMLTRSGR